MRSLLVILILVCGISSAYGQEKQQPAQGSKSTNRKTAGSEGNPFSVKQHKTAQEKTDEGKQEVDTKENMDIQRTSLKVSKDTFVLNQEALDYTRRAAWAAVIAAGAAIFAMFTAIGQLVMFWIQLGHMRKSNETAATVAAASLENTKLAHAEFVATHRPKIILRDATSEQDMGQLITVKYILCNVGDMQARVTDQRLRVKVFEGFEFGPDNLPGDVDTERESGVFILNPGEQVDLTFKSPDLHWRDNNNTCHTFLEPEYGMLFSGKIIYEDAHGTKRLTGFRRKYADNQHRFLSVDSREHYEYQN